eukprot:2518668-Pyramimonas_sp.AAC.1
MAGGRGGQRRWIEDDKDEWRTNTKMRTRSLTRKNTKTKRTKQNSTGKKRENGITQINDRDTGGRFPSGIQSVRNAFHR